MAQYNHSKAVDPAKLWQELLLEPLLEGVLTSLDYDGSVVTVHTSIDLNFDQETAVETIVTNHDSSDPYGPLRTKILKAMEFGKFMIAEFGAENVILGYTPQQMNQLAAEYQGVIMLLSTGSVKLARDVIAMTPATELVPQWRKDKYVQKINLFLETL